MSSVKLRPKSRTRALLALYTCSLLTSCGSYYAAGTGTPPAQGATASKEQQPREFGSSDMSPLLRRQGQEECEVASLDRFTEWNASGEGLTKPATGSLLKEDKNRFIAKVQFLQAAHWHVFTLWLNNQFESSVDLSLSRGLNIRYSAEAPFYVQLRPAFAWSGGNKWLARLPATQGKIRETTIDFKPSHWTTLKALGKPNYDLKSALKDARGLVFVGKALNDITVYNLRIDGFEPPCPPVTASGHLSVAH